MKCDGSLEVLGAVSLTALVRLSRITPEVLYLGYERELLSAKEIVDIELSRMVEGIQLSEAEVDLALRLSDDFETVPSFLASIVGESSFDDARHVWLYVAIKLLRSRWAITPDAVYLLACQIEDFEAPEEYADFLYYTPSRDFKRRYGRAEFLDVLDSRIRIDDVELGKSPAESEGST